MGYVIAAYVVVLGSLLAYGLRVQAQRRALLGQEAGDSRPTRSEAEPSEGLEPEGER